MWGAASVGGERGWGRDEGNMKLRVASCFCYGFGKSLFDYGPQFLGRRGNLQSKQYCFNKINKN